MATKAQLAAQIREAKAELEAELAEELWATIEDNCRDGGLDDDEICEIRDELAWTVKIEGA